MVRAAVMAGQFYPLAANSLEREVSELCVGVKTKKEAIGLLLPHAGYMYSGRVAGLTASTVNLKDIFVIIGPNHTGIGEPFSLDIEEVWQTPLGKIEINSALAEELLKKCPSLKKDTQAHRYEHSVEVELPFLQYLKSDKNFSFVPIVIGGGKLEIYKEIGKGISEAIKELKLIDQVQIIASSDMTHYEEAKVAQEKDALAISALLKLDPDLLYKTVKEKDISMCGYIPAIIMLEAARNLGAKKAELIKYENSGDTTGDYSSVVGYAGAIIS
ncbi:MAG: AmmeMemoRadiSam system protein B [Candidatus Omnitrophota bacterium]